MELEVVTAVSDPDLRKSRRCALYNPCGRRWLACAAGAGTNSTCLRRLPVGGRLGESELAGKPATATGRRGNGPSMFEGRWGDGGFDSAI